MKLTKETMITFFLTSFILALVCTIVVLVPPPALFSNLIFIVFIIYAITNAIGPNTKDIPTYICSQISGWIWVYAYFYGLLACMTLLHLAYPLAMLVAVTVVTTILLTLHLGPLLKTPFDNLSQLFSCVAFGFVFITFVPENMNAYVLNAIPAAIIGSLVACFLPKIIGLVVKQNPQQQSAPVEN